MSTIDTHVSHERESPQPTPVKVTIYHNDEARFMPYEDGQLLNAVTSHWLDVPAGGDPLAIAEWAFRTFNADLDLLETERHNPGGETTFLAACMYRLLGHRSLSVGDVVEIHTGASSQWLACDSVGWRQITEPFTPVGEPLSAATVYQHLTDQRSTR
jgi:hypothetical protein